MSYHNSGIVSTYFERTSVAFPLEIQCDWWKCLHKIWRVHPMIHCDVITFFSNCKPMEIGIQKRFCKFIANIFQNGTPVLRTIVLTALNNPLSFFVATMIPSLVTVIWIVWKSGPTCTKTGSPHCLGIWYAMLMPCLNYWACTIVHMYVLSFDETRDFIDDICLNWDFMSLHHVSPTVIYSWYLIFYSSQFTSIHCDIMCF